MIRRFLCRIGHHSYDKSLIPTSYGFGSVLTQCPECGVYIRLYYHNYKLLGINITEVYQDEE